MKAYLIRSEVVEEDGEPVQILGWLYVHNEDEELVGTFATLELPWKDNKNGVSAIPPGPGGYKEYDIELLDSSPSFEYEHYWVKDVPNRTYIKIHRGNYYTQIEGCILIGDEHVDVDGNGIKDVSNSTQSLTKLVALMGKKGTLAIQSPLF